jgi:branched-subunit amino acid aminotransferase/4-amino-4-deoxychorismate lyase
MKAYRDADDKVRLFRPMLNMNRMANSAERACLPVRTHTGYGTIQHKPTAWKIILYLF